MGRKDIIEILRDYENEVASQYDIRMPLGWKNGCHLHDAYACKLDDVRKGSLCIH